MGERRMEEDPHPRRSTGRRFTSPGRVDPGSELGLDHAGMVNAILQLARIAGSERGHAAGVLVKQQCARMGAKAGQVDLRTCFER